MCIRDRNKTDLEENGGKKGCDPQKTWDNGICLLEVELKAHIIQFDWENTKEIADVEGDLPGGEDVRRRSGEGDHGGGGAGLHWLVVAQGGATPDYTHPSTQS